MSRKPKPSGRGRLRDVGRPLGRRPVNTRPLRPRFLIVCEGDKTEPNYFRRFRVNSRVCEVHVMGLGDNTSSLVRQTCDLVRQGDYTWVWCVFDRDSFPAEQFNLALDLAQRNGIDVAYSNEAFELWYLLHFVYLDAAIPRASYGPMLTKHLGEPYRKNAGTMYDRLVEFQPDAIRNAKRLLDSYGPEHRPERDNPCTTVHLLVEQLNQYSH